MGKPLYLTAQMSADQCLGAALILCFISDLFTISRKPAFTPAEVVTVLDLIGKRELPEGLIDMVKDAANNSEKET